MSSAAANNSPTPAINALSLKSRAWAVNINASDAPNVTQIITPVVIVHNRGLSKSIFFLNENKNIKIFV
jgi:hypothetical protein